MSKALTRWFIIVDCAKKRKSLARPRIQVATGTDPDLGREHVGLTKDIMHGASFFSVQTHVKDGVAVSEQIHCDASGGVSVSADQRQVQEAVCWLFCRLVVSSHPLLHGVGLLV